MPDFRLWEPVQTFVFRSDVYHGTDPAGVIIRSLSKMSRTARTCVEGETS